jgi:hypothetical protein
MPKFKPRHYDNPSNATLESRDFIDSGHRQITNVDNAPEEPDRKNQTSSHDIGGSGASIQRDTLDASARNSSVHELSPKPQQLAERNPC